MYLHENKNYRHTRTVSVKILRSVISENNYGCSVLNHLAKFDGQNTRLVTKVSNHSQVRQHRAFKEGFISHTSSNICKWIQRAGSWNPEKKYFFFSRQLPDSAANIKKQSEYTKSGTMYFVNDLFVSSFMTYGVLSSLKKHMTSKSTKGNKHQLLWTKDEEDKRQLTKQRREGNVNFLFKGISGPTDHGHK